MGAEKFDPQLLLKDNQDRLAAPARANQEVAAAYQSQIRRQAEIFNAIMKAAQEAVTKTDVSGADEAVRKKSEAYSGAVEDTTRLMQRLSSETSAAAEEAYKNISKEVEAVIGNLQQGK